MRKLFCLLCAFLAAPMLARAGQEGAGAPAQGPSVNVWAGALAQTFRLLGPAGLGDVSSPMRFLGQPLGAGRMMIEERPQYASRFAAELAKAGYSAEAFMKLPLSQQQKAIILAETSGDEAVRAEFKSVSGVDADADDSSSKIDEGHVIEAGRKATALLESDRPFLKLGQVEVLERARLRADVVNRVRQARRDKFFAELPARVASNELNREIIEKGLFIKETYAGRTRWGLRTQSPLAEHGTPDDAVRAQLAELKTAPRGPWLHDIYNLMFVATRMEADRNVFIAPGHVMLEVKHDYITADNDPSVSEDKTLARALGELSNPSTLRPVTASKLKAVESYYEAALAGATSPLVKAYALRDMSRGIPGVLPSWKTFLEAKKARLKRLRSWVNGAKSAAAASVLAVVYGIAVGSFPIFMAGVVGASGIWLIANSLALFKDRFADASLETRLDAYEKSVAPRE